MTPGSQVSSGCGRSGWETEPWVHSGTGANWEEPLPLAGWGLLCPMSLRVPVTLGIGADIVASPMILGVSMHFLNS